MVQENNKDQNESTKPPAKRAGQDKAARPSDITEKSWSKSTGNSPDDLE